MFAQEEQEERYKNIAKFNNYRKAKFMAEVKIDTESKSKKIHVLFLCTGNSCRSQMAEGWARHIGSDIVEVNSAGIKSHGLNPYAIRVMNEAGVNITSQSSKIVTPDIIQWADLVVTVCGDANDSCPTLSAPPKKLHWPIKNPAKTIGSEEEVVAQFRIVRDEIHERVVGLISGLREEIS